MGSVSRRRLLGLSILAAVLCASPAVGATVAPRPSAGCAANTIAQGDKLERTISVGKIQRAYILDVPPAAKPHQPVPLLLDFHGFSHSALGVWGVSAFRELGKRDGFISVYPNGEKVVFEHEGKSYNGPGWEIRTVDGNRDLDFVRALLDHLEATYCIDRARVFATGFSNGGFLSHVLGCTLADRIAAIAPVSGGKIFIPCQPSRGVPVLIQHGTQDPLVDAADARAARDVWVKVDACKTKTGTGCEMYEDCRDGAVVEYCEEDYDHRWPPQATQRMWDFFQKHPLP